METYNVWVAFKNFFTLNNEDSDITTTTIIKKAMEIKCLKLLVITMSLLDLVVYVVRMVPNCIVKSNANQSNFTN